MSTTSNSIDPITDERFQLVRPLGEGGSGAVVLALDRETGEHVALKRLFKLDQKSVARFKREFRALADMHHPNLVKLYDLHRGRDAWFITMEYVAGLDLRQKLGAEAANDNAHPDLLRIFYDLACGISAIHAAGMLHRDLKPSNVLVADSGRVVVLDFGLVREIVGTARAVPRLFGREAELAQLRAALDAPGRTASMVVHVRGTSGSGKSTLVEHFLETTLHGSADDPVILRSRCYEREAMPFKALDGVMDALVSHLAQLGDLACAHILPKNVADLTRLFPVFERLPAAVHRLRVAGLRHADNTHTRLRAEQALRSLLTDAAQGRRLILWIDDMQWGDLDSARVLRGWLEDPLEAPVFIVLSYRSEELQTSPSLSLLFDHADQTRLDAQLTIDLDPLPPSDVRRLCLHRLAKQASPPAAMIERIVREADGNPFIAQQLSAIAEAKLARDDSSLDGLSMEAIIERAGTFLGVAARDLLNVLAIAGKPIKPRLALSVAGIVESGRAHIHSLRSLRLLRTRDIAGESLLEVYHDRVREAVQSALSAAESERIHTALYRQLISQRCDDHDWLHALALGAGQRAAAFKHGLHAAERASESLAFERAAELYGKCLVLFNGEMPLHELWMKLATAQAFCRRGYEAAKAYLNAAEHAPAAQRTELLQRAASHLVRSGRFEEGERIVQQVLRAQKLSVPNSQAGMLAALAWENARIAVRKVEVSKRNSESDRARAQTALLYGVLSIETQLYAPVRSALFQARALRLALDHAADTEQLARALAMSAAIICLSGTPRAATRSEQLLTRAEELLKRSDTRVPLELPCVRALRAQFLGRLNEALEPASAMTRLMEVKGAGDGLHGDYYYLFLMQQIRITALQSLGRLAEARQVLKEHIANAHATDNLAAILQVTVNRVVDEHATNMCAGSRARLDLEYTQLPKNGVNILSVAHLLAVMRAACATRDFDWAFTRLDELWRPYQRSLVHRGALLASMTHAAHARLLLNHYVETGSDGDVPAAVQQDLTELKRLPSTPSVDIAIFRTQARVAFLRGDRARAIELVRAGLERADDSVMRGEIEHDRYVLGLLVAGDDGARLVETARHAMLSSCGIGQPDASMRAYAPELMK